MLRSCVSFKKTLTQRQIHQEEYIIIRMTIIIFKKYRVDYCNHTSLKRALTRGRPAQIAELPRSKFDPELFPHSAYVEIFVTFATKVPYLTFCDKMRQFLMQEMDRERGNSEKI